LINHIDALKYRISLLDKATFSSEQDCRRTEQQLQVLTAQKYRIERLIANLLNGEGYFKVKQIIKENVKAILAYNKQLISISLVALIQTLKDDPEMVKLIQNMPSANDGEQHKDNDNIIKYIESNKDRLSDLTEKHYENLVEAFTKSAINAIDSSSSLNLTLSLPQSSSTFPNSFDQIDTLRKEESESFDNTKGDIAD
jgi:hypothetical protein